MTRVGTVRVSGWVWRRISFQADRASSPTRPLTRTVLTRVGALTINNQRSTIHFRIIPEIRFAGTDRLLFCELDLPSAESEFFFFLATPLLACQRGCSALAPVVFDRDKDKRERPKRRQQDHKKNYPAETRHRYFHARISGFEFLALIRSVRVFRVFRGGRRVNHEKHEIHEEDTNQKLETWN